MRRTSISPKNNKCVVTIVNPLVKNDREFFCRICLESNGKLLKVCSCSGSIEYVHLDCIQTWVNRFPVNHENHIKCEICKQKYLMSFELENASKNNLDTIQYCRTLTFLLLGLIFIIAIILVILLITY